MRRRFALEPDDSLPLHPVEPQTRQYEPITLSRWFALEPGAIMATGDRRLDRKSSGLVILAENATEMLRSISAFPAFLVSRPSEPSGTTHRNDVWRLVRESILIRGE